VEHHKLGRPEAPSPVALPLLLVSGFIDVVELLMRQQIDQLLPRWAEGGAGFAQKFCGEASGNLHTDYVGQKVPDAGNRSVQFALEVADQTGQARPA